jgi:hypothetical protein
MTFKRSVQDVVQDRKKYLDKVSNLLYNTNIGKGKENKKANRMINIDKIDKYTLDSSRTKEQFNKLNLVRNKLKNVYGNGELVVAGGAVRDTVLGLPYRDIDLFINDTVKEPFTSIEDTLTYDSVEASETLSEFGYYITNFGVGGNYGDSEFQVVSHSTDSFARLNECPTIQVITRKELRDGPEGLLKSFDWSLTEAYINDDGVFVSEDFVRAVESKRVEFKSRAAKDRADRWRQRTGYKITFGRLPPGEKTTTNTKWYNTGSNSFPYTATLGNQRPVNIQDLLNQAAAAVPAFHDNF